VLDLHRLVPDSAVVSRPSWLLAIVVCSAYSVFAALVSVWFTGMTGVSLWSLEADATATFPYILSINLVLWGGWALFAPLVFWLGRRFRFDREGWRRAAAIHIPAALVVTSAHLLLVGSGRFMLQRAFGVEAAWWPTVWDAFFRTLDFELPMYWVFVGGQHAIDYYRQSKARELRSAHLETRLMESQLQALQQQLHPHFLFNTLHAISSLVHRDPDKADLMIERLSDLLRITLRKVGVQEVELAEELEYLTAYLDIEQIHFGDRLRIEYRIDAAAMDVMVPTLILQPLVENAIRHGLEPMVRAGTLTIEAQADGDTLWLRVRDDGAGLPKSWTRREGVGLTNTRSRLDRLYGESAAITVRDNAGGGVRVDIYLPLRRPVGSSSMAVA
jgi:two-component system, LytTR family, sensor kinase